MYFKSRIGNDKALKNSNFAPDLAKAHILCARIIHIKSNFINFTNIIYYYVRFKRHQER